MSRFDITDHAVDRFRERVRDLPLESARDEMTRCLLAAKPKHLDRIKKKLRTAIVPTGCCVFIFDHGTMVTCLKSLALEAEAAKKKGRGK